MLAFPTKENTMTNKTNDIEEIKQAVLTVMKEIYPVDTVRNLVFDAYQKNPESNKSEYWQLILKNFQSQQENVQPPQRCLKECVKEEQQDKDYKTEIVNGNSIMIVEYIGKKSSISIPSEINGLPVKEIDRFAFDDKNLTSVIIPDTVEIIGEHAFSRNQISNLKLPISLVSVGEKAFSKNKLVSVCIPETLTEIGKEAFGEAGVVTSDLWVIIESKDDKNTEITVVDDGKAAVITGIKNAERHIPTIIRGLPVIGIAEKAYADKGGIFNGIIPDCIKFIGDSAFEKCSFKNLTLGSGLQSIGKRAFAGCSIKNLVIPKSVTKIEDETFEGNSLETVSFEGDIISIGKKAFFGNNIVKISLPDTVKSIGQEAFAKNKLTDIKIPPGAIIGKDSFNNNETAEEDFLVKYSGNGKSIIITKYIGKESNLQIPSQIRGLPVVEISWQVFFSNTYSKSVSIPDNVIIVGNSSSLNTSSKLTKIAIGKNVTISEDGSGQGFNRMAQIHGSLQADYITFGKIYEKNGRRAGVFTLSTEKVSIKKQSGTLLMTKVLWNFK